MLHFQRKRSFLISKLVLKRFRSENKTEYYKVIYKIMSHDSIWPNLNFYEELSKN